MKRILLSVISVTAAFMGAGAQSDVELRFDTSRQLFWSDLISLDNLQLDTLYYFWDDYVQAHPKNELAWRNLYEVSHAHKFKADGMSQIAYKKMCDVVGRMEQAIPDSYTFNFCAHEDDYEFAKYREGYVFDESEYAEIAKQGDKYAERAIELLPKDAQAHDYETWATYLITQKTGQDTTQLTDLLTRYFESGYYPAEALQYHFNELQGMDEGAIYIGHVEGDIYGKLILQLVLGVHRDKILYCENLAHYRPYIEAVFQQAGLSMDFFESDSAWARAEEQEEEYRLIIRYICEHSTRPVYTSANCINNLIFNKGLPDDLKACFYNEGLTMHYSAKPYDNQAVKRRNVEERYRLEYLRLSFQPTEKKNTQRFTQNASIMAFNYLLLLYDLMSYYKAHSPDRHTWLNSLFTDILTQMRKDKIGGFSLDGRFFGIEVSEEGGFHYEVKEVPIAYVRIDPREDDATQQRKSAERKANAQVLIKTESVK